MNGNEQNECSAGITDNVCGQQKQHKTAQTTNKFHCCIEIKQGKQIGLASKTTKWYMN